MAPQPQLRQQLTTLGQGICHLPQAADPEAAAKIALADAVRTARLEVLYASGEPMSRRATAASALAGAGTGPQPQPAPAHP